jgi:hypothetical protein
MHGFAVYVTGRSAIGSAQDLKNYKLTKLRIYNGKQGGGIVVPFPERTHCYLFVSAKIAPGI